MLQDRIAAVDRELKRGFFARASKSLGKRFWRTRRGERRNASYFGFHFSSLIYLGCSALDLIAVPDVASDTFAMRLFVFGLSLGVFRLLHSRNASPDTLDSVCAIGLIVGYIGWLTAASHSSNGDVVSFYRVFGVIFLMGGNLFFAFRFRLALLASTLILLASVFEEWTDPSVSPTEKGVYTAFFLGCYGLTVYLNFKTNREKYQTFLNSYRADLLRQVSADAQNELTVLSYTDPLTKVSNRRATDQHLSDRWANWVDRGEDFAVALVDVDHFKSFNDFYGHLKGDQCLVRVAEALAAIAADFRGHIGRYGGEEFILVVPLGSEFNAQAFGDLICRSVFDASLEHSGRRDGVDVVTVSAGIATSQLMALAKMEQLVQQADHSLYRAKEHGRNRSHVFSPADAVRSEKTEYVAGLLRIASERHLLSAVYQPIFNCESGKLESVEGLMRLTSLDGKPIPPPTFIPIAEECGLIIPLGLWIIERVCRDVLHPGLAPTASVNVSAVQLAVPGFALEVSKILLATGVPGHRLVMEITEGVNLDPNSPSLQTLKDLRALGIKLWLDDFGTGFAGLSWLSQIKFDAVKIDKSFVWGTNDELGRRLLADMVSLIQNRGAHIIMEGIETESHLHFARWCGAHQVQGYLLAKPGPLTKLAG